MGLSLVLSDDPGGAPLWDMCSPGVSIGHVMSYGKSSLESVMSSYMSLRQCQFLIEVRLEVAVVILFLHVQCLVRDTWRLNTLIPL